MSAYACPKAAYGCSEVAFGCRGVSFCCTVAIYGSHAADMQYMLHLGGPGWAARIPGNCPVEASPGGLGPLMTASNGGRRLQNAFLKAQD